MKIRPKGSPDWKKYNHCVIAVSIGSKNHVGDSLGAVVDFANQANFQTCTIDLSDTLHRYDFMIAQGMDEHAAHQNSREMGDLWLSGNRRILSDLKMPHVIKRWDTWLNDPRFAHTLRQFNAAFDNQEQFRTAVQEDVSGFLERRKRKGMDWISQKENYLCTKYLLEELSCHTLLYGDMPEPAATLYPGREQNCYRMVRAGKVDGVPQGLTKSYFVRLNLWEDPSQRLQAIVPLAA